jgi:hypothetical protein
MYHEFNNKFIKAYGLGLGFKNTKISIYLFLISRIINLYIKNILSIKRKILKIYFWL